MNKCSTKFLRVQAPFLHVGCTENISSGGVNDAANTDGVGSKGGGELVDVMLAMRSRTWDGCVHG